MTPFIGGLFIGIFTGICTLAALQTIAAPGGIND